MITCIGQCSLCGGRVTVPTVWHGIYPPVPTCESCGATAKASGPVIPMEKPKYRLGDAWESVLKQLRWRVL